MTVLVLGFGIFQDPISVVVVITCHDKATELGGKILLIQGLGFL